MSESDPIVFFDGVCGLCNASVDFFMRRDGSGALRFAPLQGETAAARLEDQDRQSLNSMVFVTGDQSYRRSSAVVRILRQMGGVWSAAGILLWLIPKPIRDLGYWVVASLRYRLFGRKETCRMPTPEERGRLLP